MKKIDFRAQVLPHLVAVAIFLVVVVVFFHPVFFGGKSLSQDDILQWQGSAKELMDYREKTGEEGLWTNSMFSGMPAYLINMEWKNKPVMALQKVLDLGLPHPVRIIFFSFVSFYILLLCFKVRPYLAIAGALAYGLSSFMIIGMGAGHNARMAATGLAPLVLAGIHLTFSSKRFLGMALTAVALALHLRFNHLQVTYYLLFVVAIYGLNQLYFAFKEGILLEFCKRSALLVVAAIIALGTFYGIFASTYEYGKYTMRGASELSQGGQSDGLEKEYAFQYSNGIFEPIVLFIPNFFGGASQQALGKNSHLAKALKENGLSPAQVQQQIAAVPTYWGDQPATAPYYAGAIIVFLFVLGIIIVERKIKIWLIIVAALGIVISWGSSFEAFSYFMFDYFPMYNKFRSVTFGLAITLLAMPLLGFIGLEKLLQGKFDKAVQKQFLIALGVTGGFAFLAILFAGVGSYYGAIDERLSGFPQWFLDALRADRKSLLRTDSFRSLALILLFAGTIYYFFKQKISMVLAYLIFGALILADMWLIDKRFLKDENFKNNPSAQYFAETEADRVIKSDTEHYRVLNLQNPWNEARTSYHHHSIGGYHGAKIRRYQDLISSCLDQELSVMMNNLQSGNRGFEAYPVVNMLNTKYILAGNTANAIIRNPQTNGNVWLVKDLVAVNSPDSELAELCRINTKTTAVVDQSKFKLKPTYSDSGSVTLSQYSPNQLVYNAELSGESLLVFSEIYYEKGWNAYIDGQAVPHVRVNYVLRALEVPQGKHQIEFKFEPEIYETGNAIMMASSWLLLLLLLSALAWEVRKLNRA